MCLSPGLHCLLLLPGPSSQGLAVHVPPLTTTTTVRWFIAESSGKVSRFSSHGKGYCPGCARWNKRKKSQYGGRWNHIHDLCLFTVPVDDCRLTLIHPGCGWCKTRICRIFKICTIWPAFRGPLYYSRQETLTVLHGSACQCLSLDKFWTAAEVCRTRYYPSWAEKRHQLIWWHRIWPIWSDGAE